MQAKNLWKNSVAVYSLTHSTPAVSGFWGRLRAAGTGQVPLITEFASSRYVSPPVPQHCRCRYSYTTRHHSA